MSIATKYNLEYLISVATTAHLLPNRSVERGALQSADTCIGDEHPRTNVDNIDAEVLPDKRPATNFSEPWCGTLIYNPSHWCQESKITECTWQYSVNYKKMHVCFSWS